MIAGKVEKVPETLDDEAWSGAQEAWFPMTGQVIWEPVNTDPTILGVYVKALHDGENIAMAITWDDPSYSLEGAAAPAAATDDEEDDFWGEEEEEAASTDEEEDDFWGDEEESSGEATAPVTIGNDSFAIQFPFG